MRGVGCLCTWGQYLFHEGSSFLVPCWEKISSACWLPAPSPDSVSHLLGGPLSKPCAPPFGALGIAEVLLRTVKAVGSRIKVGVTFSFSFQAPQYLLRLLRSYISRPQGGTRLQVHTPRGVFVELT